MATQTGPGFLKFNRLHVTGDDDEWDPVYIKHLQEEGFDVTYLPFGQGGKSYVNELKHLADDLELGESYGIIAFGKAAAVCLDFHIKPQPKLVALVCYYPTEIPSPKTKYPPHLEVCVHIAGGQGFAPAFPSYTYKNTLIGFAEHDLETFDKVAAALAWTRTLRVIRKSFKQDYDLEPIKEAYASQLYAIRDAKEVMSTMAPDDSVYLNCVPTMTGGIGQEDLYTFYREYFIPKNPPTLNIRLVSRTMGTDRVIDEMVISFKHTQEVPWILPGVQPTNKVVHVAVVSIVTIRGGKLVHEHLYWDQASVLVQVGLLDPKLVPDSFKKQGLKQLPVYGSETASKVLDEESQPSNELIVDWKQRQKKSAGTELPRRPKQAAQNGQ